VLDAPPQNTTNAESLAAAVEAALVWLGKAVKPVLLAGELYV
jgi:hypothetical protein